MGQMFIVESLLTAISHASDQPSFIMLAELTWITKGGHLAIIVLLAQSLAVEHRSSCGIRVLT